MKKALFLRFLRCLLITDLYDNLESGKRNYCFGKKCGKSLEFISCYLCKAFNGSEKKDQPWILGSKAGMVKRPEKNCYQACPIGSLENFDAKAGV